MAVGTSHVGKAFNLVETILRRKAFAIQKAGHAWICCLSPNYRHDYTNTGRIFTGSVW